MIARTKLTVLVSSVVLLTALLALGLASVSAAPGVDLVISKSSDPSAPGPVIAGEELFYHISVRNDGDTTATNVLVTDTLPYYYEALYVGDTGDCYYDGYDELVCNLGTMEPGEQREFDVKMLVYPWLLVEWWSPTYVLENDVVVGSDEADDNPNDNTASHSIFVQDSADLSVMKMSKPDTEVQAGELFTYTIFVENLGPSFARFVGMRDELLSSGAFEIVDYWTDRDEYEETIECAVESTEPGISNTLFCGLWYLEPKGYLYGYYPEELPFFDTGQWTIYVVLRANETQDVNNVVQVFPLTEEDPFMEGYYVGTPDPDWSNNTAEDFIYVTDVADLSLSKSYTCLGPYGCVAGGPARFDLSVSNIGPSTAEGVVLEDYLPAGVTVDEYTVLGGGDCNTGTPGDPTDPLICYLGNIAPGDPAKQVQVFVHIDADYPVEYIPGWGWQGWLENDAWVYSSIFDPDNSDNLDSVIVEPYTASDMFIQKACGSEEVVAGVEHEYIVLVSNDGPSTVRNFRFWDKLPDDVTYLDYAVEGGGGECFYTEALPGGLGGGQGVHCWLGDIAPGTERAVHLTVRVNADVAPDSELWNTVPGWDADSDIWSVTGEQSCYNYVMAKPDLSIEKTSEPVKLYPGEQKIYHITVTNEGPSVAFGVTVSDTLPAGVEYETSTGDCSFDGDEVQCAMGDMGPGDTGSFDIYARVLPDTPPAEIVNTACVTSEWDIEYENGYGELVCDTATNYIMDPNQADLALVKTVSPEPYFAGELVTYTLTVSNTGPLVAQNVTLEDLLPEGLTVVGVFVDEGSCTTGTPGTEPLVCSLGNLEVDQEVSVQVEAFIDPGYQGVMENDAVVDSEVYDQNEGNNRAHVLIWVEPFSNLGLLKEGPPDIQAGEQIEYWINLWNEGPSTAHDVYLNDELPGGISLLDAEVMVGDGSCEPDSALCSLGDLEPGANRGIRVRGNVEPWLEAESIISNTASLWANSPFNGTDWPDGFFGLRSVVTTTVHNTADLSIIKTSDPYKVYAGEQKRYDIEVTNLGPGVAYNVVVTDTFDEGVEYEISTADCDYTPPTMLGSTQPWWFEDEDGGGALFSVDLDSGAGSLIGQMPEWLASEVEYDNLSGRLFAAQGFEPWYGDDPGPRLYELDPATGAEMGYADLDEDCALPGLEFVGDTLYGSCSEYPGADPYLATVDPDTGDVTMVGGYMYVYDQIHGLAYDESSGIMYGLEAGGGTYNDLWAIDLDDGEAHWVCDVWDADDDWYEDDLRAIEFGPDGVLYGGLTLDDGGYYGLVRIDINEMYGYCNMYRIGNPGFSITGLTLMEGSDEAACHLGEIPPGETSSFSIWVRVKADTLGMINNRVHVLTDTEDPNPDNNWDTEANLVLGKADVRVQKYGPSGPVEAPGPLIYTIVVDNLGPGYAHNVVLNDVFNWNDLGGYYYEEYYVEDVYSDRPADCWWDYYGYDWEEAHITCQLYNPLEVMSQASSGRWEVKVYVDVLEESSVTNVVDVTTVPGEDPDLSNNHDEANNDVEPVTDLQLYKSAYGEIPDECGEPPYPMEPDRVAAGATMWYELEVCNYGPSVAKNVVLEDWEISPLLEITDVEWNGGVTCLLGDLGEQGDTDRRLTCYMGYLPDYIGEEYCKSVYIEARVPSDVAEGTTLLNEAMVYGELYDHQNWNNFATNSTTVEVWADLGVEKTQEPEISLPTWDTTYTITITNSGPSDAHDVFISDTIPVQLLDPTWTCCASDDGECDIPCEPPVCPEEPCPWPDIGLYARADIPAGEWAIYTVNGILDWWPCGPFTNTVELIAPQSLLYPETDIDFCDENDTDIAVNDPCCHYDPLVLKAFPGPDSIP